MLKKIRFTSAIYVVNSHLERLSCEQTRNQQGWLVKFVLNPIRLLPLVVLRIILEGELKEAIEMLLNHKDTNTQLKNIDGNTIFDFDMDYNPEVLELLNKHLK